MSDLPSDLIPTRWEALGATLDGLKAYVKLCHGRDYNVIFEGREIEEEYLDALEATADEPTTYDTANR